MSDKTLEKWVSRYKTNYGYPKMLRLLTNGEHGRSLEVGAGKAFLSYLLTHRGWDTTALDLYNYGSLAERFVLGSAFGLPFIDKSFDLVFSCGLLEHLDWEEQITHIMEMKRVGERFVCLFPTCDWKWRLLWKLRKVPGGRIHLPYTKTISFLGMRYGCIHT